MAQKRRNKKSLLVTPEEKLADTQKKHKKAYKSFVKSAHLHQYVGTHLKDQQIFDGPLIPGGGIDLAEADETTKFVQTNNYDLEYKKDTGFLEAQMQYKWIDNNNTVRLDIPNGLSIGKQSDGKATFDSVQREILRDHYVGAAEILTNPYQETPAPEPRNESDRAEHLVKIRTAINDLPRLTQLLKQIQSPTMQTIHEIAVADNETAEA